MNLVSRVVNTYGPQTRSEGIQGSGHNSMLRDCGNQAVEERLQNIEAHLRLQTGKQSAWQCPIVDLWKWLKKFQFIYSPNFHRGFVMYKTLF